MSPTLKALMSLVLCEGAAATRRRLEGGGVTVVVTQATCPCLAASPISTEYIVDGMLERPATGEMFALAYGVGCSAHNENETACVGMAPPAWCMESWCWVNAENCNDPAIPAVIASGGSSYFPDSPGAVSVYLYAACGDGDSFTDSEEDPTKAGGGDSDAARDGRAASLLAAAAAAAVAVAF